MNNRKILKWVAGAIITIIALFLIYLVKKPLIKGISPILYAVLITYILSPIISRLEKNNIPRIVSVSAVYILIILFISLAAYYLFPQILKGIRAFSGAMPKIANDIKCGMEHYYSQYLPNGLPQGMQSIADKNIINLQNNIEGRLANTGTFIAMLFSGTLEFVLGFVLAFYLLLDMKDIIKYILNIPLCKKRKIIPEIICDIDIILSSFIRGQLLVSVILSIILSVGLGLLNVKYPILLGFIGGMMDIVPYFGPILGSLPAIVTALIQEPIKALWVLLLFILVQQIEGIYLSPKLVGRNIGLHPIFAITAVIVGGEMFGILGMLFAVPLLAMLKAVFCRIKSTYFPANE